MNILITGASGFIGSHLTPLLVAQGHAFDPPYDVCVHLAWKGCAGSGGADENIDSVRYSLDVLRSAHAMGCARFVGVGSCYEYAETGARVHEGSRLHPSGPNPSYAFCKTEFSNLARHYCESVGMSFAWARVFNCYGPREPRTRLVPTIINGLLDRTTVRLSPGAQVRDYLHVADVASALARIATSDVRGAVNVCSAKSISVRQLAAAIEGHSDSEYCEFGALPYREHDPMQILGDNRTLCALGWRPSFSLRAGLAETLAWWTAQRRDCVTLSPSVTLDASSLRD